MNTDNTKPSTGELLSAERLAPSAALYAAYLAIDAALRSESTVVSRYGQQTIDLLLRLHELPKHAGRAVDLADRVMVSTSHMSRVIDKVEALGLVERILDPNDRRAKLVVLTPEGSDVLAVAAPHIAKTLDRVIHNTLQPAEVTTLINLLGRIEREARTPQPTDPLSG